MTTPAVASAATTTITRNRRTPSGIRLGRAKGRLTRRPFRISPLVSPPLAFHACACRSHAHVPAVVATVQQVVCDRRPKIPADRHGFAPARPGSDEPERPIAGEASRMAAAKASAANALVCDRSRLLRLTRSRRGDPRARRLACTNVASRSRVRHRHDRACVSGAFGPLLIPTRWLSSPLNTRRHCRCASASTSFGSLMSDDR